MLASFWHFAESFYLDLSVARDMPFGPSGSLDLKRKDTAWAAAQVCSWASFSPPEDKLKECMYVCMYVCM